MSNQNLIPCTDQVQTEPLLKKPSKFVAYFGPKTAARGYVQIPLAVWSRTDISAAEKVTYAIVIGFLQGEALRPLPANSPSNSLFSRFTGKTSRQASITSLQALESLGIIKISINEMTQRVITPLPQKIHCDKNWIPRLESVTLKSAFCRRWGPEVTSLGWIEFPKAVLHDPSLSDESKVLYGVLLSDLYSQNLKVSDRNSDWFAGQVGASRRSVIRWLQDLEKGGFILTRGNPKRLIEINTTELEEKCTPLEQETVSDPDQCDRKLTPPSDSVTVPISSQKCDTKLTGSVTENRPIKDLLKESEEIKTDRQGIPEREWSELLWIVSRSSFLQKLQLLREDVETLSHRLGGADHALRFIDAVGFQALSAKTPIVKPALYFKTLSQTAINQKFDYPANYVHFRDRMRVEKEKILAAAKKAQPDLPWPKVLDEILLEAKEKMKAAKCFDETNDCIILLDTLKEAQLTPVEIEGCFWFCEENILSPTIVERGLEYCRRKGTRINFANEQKISVLLIASRKRSQTQPLGRIQEATDLWASAKKRIKNAITPRAFQSNIEPLTVVGFEGNILQIRCDNKFKADWINEQYLNIIVSALKLGKNEIEIKAADSEEILSS
jgi:hypothetical protein